MSTTLTIAELAKYITEHSGDIGTLTAPEYEYEHLIKQLDAYRDLLTVVGLADQVMEQILPQARRLVLDVGVANELCLKIREVKNREIV